MGKIKLNKGYNRRLIAVLGGSKEGLFIRNSEDASKCHYVRLDTSIPEVGEVNPYSLEEALKGDSMRTGIYEGDSITINF